MDKRRPIVGETLYSLNVGNAAIRCEQVLTPVTVVSVGRKYFDCQRDGGRLRTRFFLETWRATSDFANAMLYENPGQWEQEKNIADLWKKIKQRFDHYGKPDLSMDQLIRINAIIEEKGE